MRLLSSIASVHALEGPFGRASSMILAQARPRELSPGEVGHLSSPGRSSPRLPGRSQPSRWGVDLLALEPSLPAPEELVQATDPGEP